MLWRKQLILSFITGQARPSFEEEPIEEPGCSSEAEPIRQDCTSPGASAPGLLLPGLHPPWPAATQFDDPWPILQPSIQGMLS